MSELSEKRPAGASALRRDLATVPNLVSLARVVFVYVTIALWFQGRFRIGVVIGVLAGLSDYLDGYLARRLGQTTRIGGLLDQAADVLFMSGCILLFIVDGTWPAALLLVFLCRETVVMNLRASASEMGFSLPSIFLGKWASNWMFWSLALMGFARAELVLAPYDGWIRIVSHVGMAVGIVSSVVTAAIYAKSYAAQYRPREDAPQVRSGRGPRGA